MSIETYTYHEIEVKEENKPIQERARHYIMCLIAGTAINNSKPTDYERGYDDEYIS